jgi:ribonucleoside-diphosphate reductase alpha chain
LLLSKLYKWTDASISCTFNLPNSSTTQDVENIYLSAYDLGVRAVSVYREGSREGILIFDDPKSHQSKEQKRNVLCQTRPDFIEYHCAPKRPRNLDCDVHHINVRGVKWLVLIGKLNNTAYEIFAGMKEDLYLPKSVTTGSIEKKGGGTYALNVKIRGNEVQYKSIADVLMTSEQKAITRMISVSLRHGVPTEFIEEQIKKSKNDITDFSSAVSRILSKYRTNIVITKDICPQCNEPMVKTGGCKQCMNCNFSACE